MKIKVLIENTSNDHSYLTEHGLSLYIETKNHTLLFDVGQSDAFLENAKKVDVDITKVDMVFLSHGHYDHGGGLKAFLEVNHSAKVYINAEGFSDLYSEKNDGKLLFIGLDQSLKNHKQIVILENDFIIDEELEVLTRVSNKYTLPSMNQTLMKKNVNHLKDVFELDDFAHEQNLIIREGDNHFLFAGCAHHGIMNILDSFYQNKGFYPNSVISGFHLASDRSGFIESEEILSEIRDYLKETKSKYYTGHCTGSKPYNYLHEYMGDDMQYMYTGRIINI